MTDEAAMLLRVLDSQRQHVLQMLDGLSAEALLHAALPSGWTPAGLVRHLTYDVERFWFRQVMLGETAVEVADAWHLADGMTGADAIAEYRVEVDRANDVIKSTSLDIAPAWWPGWWPDWRYDNLRRVILHVLVETANHAGHLDAARELIDGTQWLVLG